MIGPNWDEQRFCALLFSADGVLIKIYAGERMHRWLNGRSIRVWTNWSEGEIGPNIFSVGIHRSRLTHMSGVESFAALFLEAEWYFSPICTADGSVLGGLSMVTMAEDPQNLLGSLTTAICKNIALHDLWFDMLRKATDVTEGMGFLSLDQSNGENRLLTMSNEIFKMLGLTADDYYYNRLEAYIDPAPDNAELVAALKACGEDAAVQVVILNSTGKAFSAGGDIGAMYKGIQTGGLDFGGAIAKMATVSLVITAF